MDERAVEREAFLQKYYHHLVRCIQPNLFYSWLRTKKVINEDEQEEVDTKYHVRSLRAGCLIDLIMRKGEAGYVAFMECVEYLYPDLYKDLTGKEASPPPNDFHGRSIRRVGTDRTRNSDTLCLMAKLLQNLTQDITKKNIELQQLKALFDGVKEECNYEENEKISLCTELELTREKNDELQSDNEELRRKLRAAIVERDSSKRQCHELLVVKEDYFNQCNLLRQRLEKTECKVGELHGEVRRERSVPRGVTEIEKLKRKNQELAQEIEMHVQQCKNPCHRKIAGDSSIVSVVDLKSRNAELEKKVEDLTMENCDLLNENVSLEERCEMLQENSDKLQSSMKCIIAERDQHQKLCEELKEQLTDSRKRRDEMATQCRLYHDRICAMSERIQYLDEEIVRLRHVACCESSSPTLRPGKQNGEPRFQCEYKRKASYETLGKNEPLVVFAPKEIKCLLYKHLKSHFGICEFCTFERNPAQEELDSEDGIYWKKSANEYNFIDKAWLQQKNKNNVVLSIPVHCIRIMKEKLKVNPIVVVIKYRSHSSMLEYTHEEEVLSKPKAIRFAIVTVDETYKTCFTDCDAISVVNELKKIVDMENKLQAES